MRWLTLTCLIACSGGSSPPSPDAGTPIEAPLEQWTFVPLAGMRCADGSPTGVGVNLTSRSDRVAVYFQGGGACWDGDTCFVFKTAINVETGYGDAAFQTDLATLDQFWLFQRTASPLSDASWIYVPYCTGDLHDGTRTATYTVAGASRTAEHVGGINADIVLSRAAATRPAADVVWLLGISAGAYGVGFNFGNAHRAWPGAKVHALADSSPLVTLEPTRWAAMQANWAMRFPAGCTGCATDLGTMPPVLAAETPPGDRYGLLAYTRDQTIVAYFGLTSDELQTRVLAEQAAMSGDQAAFVLAGMSHVLLGNPGLQTSGALALSTWVEQWATGDPAWANAGP